MNEYLNNKERLQKLFEKARGSGLNEHEEYEMYTLERWLQEYEDRNNKLN
jgi:hypothetical protein